MAGEESILRAEKIYKNFPVKTNRHLTVRAVSDVSLTIRVGEIYGLVGESGCGKSTLGRVISYLIPPTSGKVWLNDTDLSALPKKELRRQRQNIQMVFQGLPGLHGPTAAGGRRPDRGSCGSTASGTPPSACPRSSTSSSRWGSGRSTCSAIPTSSPAGSGSASAWPARFCSTRP